MAKSNQPNKLRRSLASVVLAGAAVVPAAAWQVDAAAAGTTPTTQHDEGSCSEFVEGLQVKNIDASTPAGYQAALALAPGNNPAEKSAYLKKCGFKPPVVTTTTEPHPTTTTIPETTTTTEPPVTTTTEPPATTTTTTEPPVTTTTEPPATTTTTIPADEGECPELEEGLDLKGIDPSTPEGYQDALDFLMEGGMSEKEALELLEDCLPEPEVPVTTTTTTTVPETTTTTEPPVTTTTVPETTTTTEPPVVPTPEPQKPAPPTTDEKLAYTGGNVLGFLGASGGAIGVGAALLAGQTVISRRRKEKEGLETGEQSQVELAEQDLALQDTQMWPLSDVANAYAPIDWDDAEVEYYANNSSLEGYSPAAETTVMADPDVTYLTPLGTSFTQSQVDAAKTSNFSLSEAEGNAMAAALLGLSKPTSIEDVAKANAEIAAKAEAKAAVEVQAVKITYYAPAANSPETSTFEKAAPQVEANSSAGTHVPNGAQLIGGIAERARQAAQNVVARVKAFVASR